MGTLISDLVQANTGVKVPSFNGDTNYPTGLGASDAGFIIYDSSKKTLVFWNGIAWNECDFLAPQNGTTQDEPITDFSTWIATSPSSGTYWIKPSGYTGTAEQVYIAVNDGTQSGITSGGVWVRIRYAQSYFQRSDAWRGQSGLSDPANQSSTAYSGDFSYEQSNGLISALLQTGNFTEIRQIFESWGYGSVGWTYGSGYMESKGFDDVNYTRWGSNSNIVGKSYTRVAGMSHSTSSINGSFDNPTGNGTDATDANDSTWRYGRFYFKYVPPSGSSALPLPIKGIWNADVDGSSEQRYFPFRDSAGGSSGQGDSNIWIKIG